MKISLQWAQTYSEVNLNPNSTQELVQLATERLGGVEGYTEYAQRYENIYVAKIVTVAKHPNADKLHVCKIDDGGVAKKVERDENGYVQIVCGASVVEAGWLIGWLAPGASVPGWYDQEVFTLESKELRGQISYGMMGTPKELGVSADESGLLVINPEEFADEVVPGMPFAQLLGFDDVVIDVENKMFTHRPDCFGILGVARELAGIQHQPFTSPDWYLKKPEFKDVSRLTAEIQNDAGDLAPRVMMVAMDGVEVQPSPLWMQATLTRVGIRPINAIVDVTNYIMYLTAQPMHAFDYDKLADRSKNGVVLGPRMAHEGESLTLLGGKKVQLTKDDIVLATDTVAVDIAGVMGGEDTEVDENTKRILLTCCSFDMYAVRRMTMRHGVFTDAATRNTKGQPPEQVDRVLAYAMSLMQQYAHAKQASAVLDDYKKPRQNGYIEVTAKFINERLGSKLSEDQIIRLLTNVEFKAHKASGPISVTPPFWRTDIEIAEDIVEEVGRLHGFNQLPHALPERSIEPVTPDPQRELKREIRQSLARAGANEVLTYSFVHGNLFKKVGQDHDRAFAIRNALSPDLQFYRLSILPSLLDKVHANIKAGYDEFVLFEIGKTHSKHPDDKPGELPDEYNVLEMVYTSSKPKSGAAYYRMLKYVDTLLSDLHIPYRLEKPDTQEAKVVQADKPFDMDRSARIFYKNAEQGGLIGLVGELEQSVITSCKLPIYTAAATFALDGASFTNEARTANTYIPLSRYPSTDQDITLKVAADLAYAQLEDLIKDQLEASEYQWSLQVVSIFQEDTSKTKNISFRITLSHYDHTLTTDEATQLIIVVAQAAKKQLGAQQV